MKDLPIPVVVGLLGKNNAYKEKNPEKADIANPLKRGKSTV